MQQNKSGKILSFSQTINDELKHIYMWIEMDKLSLNVKTTKYIIFFIMIKKNMNNHIPKLE